jgi:RNA ligase (TIGR02306 family)
MVKEETSNILDPSTVYENLLQLRAIPLVPILYVGPFSKEILAQYTDGKETVSGRGVHIREGCVVKPFEERYDDSAGRAILKSVSDAYLLQDNTEFQ